MDTTQLAREGAEGAVDFKELARLTQRSLASLGRDDAAGRIPKGFRLGRSRRWLKEEILAWLRAGAPDRRTWEHVKQAQARRD